MFKTSELFFLSQFLVTLASATLFTVLNDNRCLYLNISQRLETNALTNARQCAILCSTTTLCAIMMVVPSNNTCELYAAINTAYYNTLMYTAPGQCRIGILVSNCTD